MTTRSPNSKLGVDCGVHECRVCECDSLMANGSGLAECPEASKSVGSSVGDGWFFHEHAETTCALDTDVPPCDAGILVA